MGGTCCRVSWLPSTNVHLPLPTQKGPKEPIPEEQELDFQGLEEEEEEPSEGLDEEGPEAGETAGPCWGRLRSLGLGPLCQRGLLSGWALAAYLPVGLGFLKTQAK